MEQNVLPSITNIFKSPSTTKNVIVIEWCFFFFFAHFTCRKSIGSTSEGQNVKMTSHKNYINPKKPLTKSKYLIDYKNVFSYTKTSNLY